MNDTAEDVRLRRQQQIAALVESSVAPNLRATLQAFIARYYEQVDPEDLQERIAGRSLRRGALALELRPQARAAAMPRVRAFNPTIEEHGWQSKHTIVEIVNDDMPFLVDSVAMEANRHGLTLHLIIHPIIARRASARRHADGARDRRFGERVRESFIHLEVDRMHRCRGARRARGRHRRACWTTCAPP